MNRTTYQKAMQQISASEEEIRMKAKQIQAQYNTNKKIRRTAGRRKLFAGLAAAAVVMIGGTITVGALNDWNYSSLMNRYFKEWFRTESDYSFEGQGMDINDTFGTEDYQITVESVVFNSDSYYLFSELRFSDALTEKIRELGDDAMVDMTLASEVLAPGRQPSFMCSGCTGTMTPKADGVYSLMLECPFTDGRGNPFTDDFADLRLAVKPGVIGIDARTGENSIESVFREDYTEYRRWADVTREYSLEPVVSAPGIFKESPVTLDLPSAADGAAAKQFTFDTLTVTPTKLILRYTSDNDTEAEQAAYSEIRADDLTALQEGADVRLRYDSGKKLTFRNMFCEYTLGEEDDGRVTLFELSVPFTEPVDTEGLKEISINGTGIPLN